MRHEITLLRNDKNACFWILQRKIIDRDLPFMVTQGHRNWHRSICQEVATIGLSSTVSEINGKFSRKPQIFPTSHVSNASDEGSPWNWVTSDGLNKTTVMGLSGW